MKKHYPYTLEKNGDTIKLEIMPKSTYDYASILYVVVIFMSTISVIGVTISLFFNNDFTPKDYLIITCVIIGCILFFMLAFYLLRWRRKGREIFMLCPNTLESIIIMKSFRTEKRIFNFNHLEIGYQSGEDYYSEEEAKELGVELNLDKVAGYHQIQFYMDGGEQVIDSEREIPIELIRKRKVYIYQK